MKKLRHRAAQPAPRQVPVRPAGLLQRRAAGRAALASVPPSVNGVVGSPGRPLDTPTRLLMESRLGHDFSRVHTDARAAESARSVGAHAYTVGRDIAFDTGRFAAETQEGRQLLAHELTHVTQQGQAGEKPGAPPADDAVKAFEIVELVDTLYTAIKAIEDAKKKCRRGPMFTFGPTLTVGPDGKPSGGAGLKVEF